MVFLGTAVAALALAPAAHAVTGAAFTTFDDPAACLDGNAPNGINCNNYANKDGVYTSGGPTTAGLGDGEYYFAVLTPGSQNGGFIEGADGNLSDQHAGGTTGDLGTGDEQSNRTFTVTGGVISSYPSATHATGTDPQGHPVIQLAPYDDTDNPGGVYILAICKVGATSPSDCKTDMFKVAPPDGVTPPVADLTIDKNATADFTRTFPWSIAKLVDKTRVEQIGGTATFNYTVNVTKGTGVDGGWVVNGTIEIANPNNATVSDVTVDDHILVEPHATCVIDGDGIVGSMGPNEFDTLSYTCTYSAAPASSDETNEATITWNPLLGDGTTTASTSNSVDVGFSFPSAPGTVVDDCANVTDSFAGGPQATPCASATYTYARTVPVPASNCVSYGNTASFTTLGLGLTGSDSKTVTVCGPAKTGALTMGFWQNKNGQGIISGEAKTGVCPSGTWLRQFAPFQGTGGISATATCGTVATWVYNVIKAANASGTSMNAMLKAQMLATALDVYFSDPALGTNKIGAPGPIGGVKIDLTKICKMIDASGGSASCGGSYQNASSAFGGATGLTVMQLLTYAATQSNVGGTTWYAQVKATQELAKNTFDAINNGVAFPGL
jgi:hypothetical protein